MSMEKRCTRCGGPGPFHRRAASKDGLSPRCVACKAKSDTEYKKSHADAVKKRRHEYYMSHRDRLLADGKARTAKKSEQVKEYRREWYLRNKKRVAERSAEWRARNPERAAELKKLWYAANKKKVDDRVRSWVSANRERTREMAKSAYHRNIEKARASARERMRRRRLRQEKGLRGLSTAERAVWHEILERFDYRCAYCLERADRLEREHVTAVANGGGGEPENLVPACRTCNARKGDRPIFMMARYITNEAIDETERAQSDLLLVG